MPVEEYRRLAEDDEPAGQDPELRRAHLADEVAIDLQGQGLLIQAPDAELPEPREGVDLPVPHELWAAGQRPPQERGDVERTGPPEHHHREVAAVERRALAELHGALAEVRVRRRVLDDRRHPGDTLLAELGLETRRVNQVVAVERPNGRDRVVPLAEALLEPRVGVDD